MKKLLVVFVFVLSSWVVRGEEEKVSVTMEPMSLSVQPARFQFVKDIYIPTATSSGILIDTEQGKVWELTGKRGDLRLVPVPVQRPGEPGK